MEDLAQINISAKDVSKRKEYREKIRQQKIEQTIKVKRKGKKWTEKTEKRYSSEIYLTKT